MHRLGGTSTFSRIGGESNETFFLSKDGKKNKWAANYVQATNYEEIRLERGALDNEPQKWMPPSFISLIP